MCLRARPKAKVLACLLGLGPGHFSYYADDEEEHEKMDLHRVANPLQVSRPCELHQSINRVSADGPS